MNDKYYEKKKEEIIKRTKAINQTLRKAHFSSTPMLDDIRRKPFFGKMIDGMPTESLGPFPEFILPTHPCAKTMQGYCSPCFFSKVSMSNRSSKEIYESLLVQTQYIINNFDEIVINYQSREDDLKNYYDVTFCYACNGSLFSNSETNPDTRYKAFKMLSDEINKRKLKSLVYIETCVGDYLRFLESEEFNDIYPLLKQINATILFGFESVNETTRNCIYLKDMSIKDFEKAVISNNRLGLQTGAFIYFGFHSMTQNEIIIDVKDSLEYLNSLNVMPVIMFPNLQEYTLTHLLYEYNRFNLIDPRTSLKIFELMISIFGMDGNKNHDNWLTGDLFGGPPAPPTNSFNNKRKASCDICSEEIRNSLQTIRKKHNVQFLYELNNKLSNCPNNCNLKYEKQIDEESHITKEIIDRIIDNISFAEQHIDEYIDNMVKRNEQYLK